MDAFATAISLTLQYGVPLEVLVNKFSHVRFEPPAGPTTPRSHTPSRIIDYIFRWLASSFLTPEEQLACGVNLEPPTLAEKGKSDVEVSNIEVSDRLCNIGESAPQAAAEPVPSKQMNIEEAVAARDSQSVGSDALTMGFDIQSDAPACDTCGALMVRNGACYKCLNCGSTSGCS